jgi:hypothetical protein
VYRCAPPPPRTGVSNAAETLAVRPGRPAAYRVWKIVAVVVFGLAAVPVTLIVGTWAANQIADGSPATPSSVTVPTR